MLAVENAFEFILDATPPQAPQISLYSMTNNSITVKWDDYQAPDDLYQYESYIATSQFQSIENMIPVSKLEINNDSYTFSELEPFNTFYITIVAVSDQFRLTVVNTNDSPIVANPIPDQFVTENAAFNITFDEDTLLMLI
jgi:hypothetical protein